MCQIPDRAEESCVMTEVHFEQVRDAETEVTENPAPASVSEEEWVKLGMAQLKKVRAALEKLR